MLSVPSSENVEFNRYLFEYRYDGAEWGIQILARSPEEARERIGALTWATYKGEIAAQISLPGAGWFRRILSRMM